MNDISSDKEQPSSGGPCETPLDDLERSALAHYEELSGKACQWLSTIPHAIRFYFDAKRKDAAARPSLGTPSESLDRLQTEAERWAACVAGDGSTCSAAAKALRDIVAKAAALPKSREEGQILTVHMTLDQHDRWAEFNESAPLSPLAAPDFDRPSMGIVANNPTQLEALIVEAIRRCGVKSGTPPEVYGAMCHEVRDIIALSHSATPPCKARLVQSLAPGGGTVQECPECGIIQGPNAPCERDRLHAEAVARSTREQPINAAAQAASTLANVEVPESDPAAKVSGEPAPAAPIVQSSTEQPVAWMWLEGTELLNGTEVEQFERVELSRQKPEGDPYGLTPLYTHPVSAIGEKDNG